MFWFPSFLVFLKTPPPFSKVCTTVCCQCDRFCLHLLLMGTAEQHQIVGPGTLTHISGECKPAEPRPKKCTAEKRFCLGYHNVRIPWGDTFCSSGRSRVMIHFHTKLAMQFNNVWLGHWPNVLNDCLHPFSATISICSVQLNSSWTHWQHLSQTLASTLISLFAPKRWVAWGWHGCVCEGYFSVSSRKVVVEHYWIQKFLCTVKCFCCSRVSGVRFLRGHWLIKKHWNDQLQAEFEKKKIGPLIF